MQTSATTRRRIVNESGLSDIVITQCIICFMLALSALATNILAPSFCAALTKAFQEYSSSDELLELLRLYA